MKFLVGMFLLMIFSCAHNPPEIDVQYWAGDSKTSSIQRAQNNEMILCSDKKFDDMVCESYDGLKKIHETYINECAMWRDEAKKVENRLYECGLINPFIVSKVRKCLEK